MDKAIEAGFVQKEIQESAYRYQKRVEEKEQIIVSLNAFTDATKKLDFHLYSPPKEVEKNQVERLKQVRSERSESQVKQHLESLKEAAREGRNVFPPILEAVRSLATLEEMASALRDIYGTYQENVDI
jgi:methylmalonyl-CoA mutase N-terminal domain/subunit